MVAVMILVIIAKHINTRVVYITLQHGGSISDIIINYITETGLYQENYGTIQVTEEKTVQKNQKACIANYFIFIKIFIVVILHVYYCYLFCYLLLSKYY